MSFINDALIKARQEKNNRYSGFGDVIPPPKPPVGPIASIRKWIMGITVLFVLLAATTLTLYYYKIKEPANTLAPSKIQQQTRPPVPLPAPAPAKGSTSTRIPLKEETLTPVPATTPLLATRLTNTRLPSKKETLTPVRPPDNSPAKALTKTFVASGREARPTVSLSDRSHAKAQNVQEQKRFPVPDAAAAAKFYREALALQRTGRVAEAEALYEKVLAKDPKHIQALNNLGVIYMSRNNNSQAVSAFRRAITLKKDYADPYYNLACLHSKWNNIDSSLRNLKIAISINSEIVDWARTDNDFNNMRTSPEFKRLTGMREDE